MNLRSPVKTFAFLLICARFIATTLCAEAQVPESHSDTDRLFREADLEQLVTYLDENPTDHLKRRQYADALFEFGRFKEAASHYEIFLQHFQGAPDTIHRYLIAIAGYPGDNLRGERATVKYLSFYPADHELYMRLGYFRLWQSKHEEALDAFTKALELQPDDFESQKGAIEAQAGINLDKRLARFIPDFPTDSLNVPLVDEQRFQFILELMHYQRYSSAYEELMRLAGRHDKSRRWLALYAQIDAALISSIGKTPAYPIDRYLYLLEHQPDNIALRYSLVEKLIESNRIGEAYEVLIVPEHADPLDSIYVELLGQIDERKENWATERVGFLKQKLDKEPDNDTLIKELIEVYLFLRRQEDTLEFYERLLTLQPEVSKTRLNYALALFETGRFADALIQTEVLLEQDPLNATHIHLYAQLALASQGTKDRAIELLNEYLELDPEHVDALLDLSELYLTEGRPLKADTLLRRAYTLGLPRDRNRLYVLDHRIGSALLKQKRANKAYFLQSARRHANNQEYIGAIDHFHQYLELKGERTQKDLYELAKLYSLSGDYTMALSILYELKDKGASTVILKDIARNRYYLGDHAGAIMEMEAYLDQYPRDAEASALLQQIYLEVQQFALADSLARGTRKTAQNSDLERSFRERFRERIHLVERSVSTDYVGLVVPVSTYTRARGSVTSYEHWAQGLLTQITMPAEPRPFVVTAGLVSHFLEGTRRLTPGTPFSLSRINQVVVGSYFDLTEPDHTSSVGYTNRLRFSAGIFDYSGGRTAGFAELQYLRNVTGKYALSLGLQNTEASIPMWSPAGGEFGLRLTQVEAKLSSRSILPDSSLRVSAELDVNLVKGIRDSTLSSQERNLGTDFRVEISYELLPYTFLGLAFNALSYQESLDTYFSPSSYRAYDIWVEYERELIGKWFTRSRVTTGLAFYRRGSFALRAETDLIYRFASQLSFSINAMAGYSVRFLDNTEALRNERYRMALFSAALYWTL